MDENTPQTSDQDTKHSQLLACLPHGLLQSLMPFQREGVEFALCKDGRCMIADEMGLGKTVQAIAVACAYRGEWPLLVVTPSSLKYPWIEELERWIPDLGPGDVKLVESKTDTISISSGHVTVLGYGLLTTDAHALIQALNRRRFSVVVVDESHYLKSRTSARAKILLPVIQSAKRALLLTGTPALGRPEELFMQIEALYPKSFGTWSDYATKYCNAHYRYFGHRRQWDCRGASNLEDLHQRLTNIMIRRLKAHVLPQLPPKIRQRIPFDLPQDYAKEALDSFSRWERLMKGLGSGVVAVDNPFSEVMSLVTHMYKQTAVAKAGAVKDYIKMMLEVEQLKFLVFAHHLTMLQACTQAMVESKVGYIRIDGSVPSSERIKLVQKFQSDPGTRVAVLSIQAAGQGLTLTAASHVVFAELYWNPGHLKQAEDRAHRIGQKASVNVHYLIANGTFDTVMWAMLNRKETVTGSTLNGRKEYLNADEGDKDQWEFLSFANAWAPSDTTPPQDGDANYFTHFEKEKQHDIRSFFGPNSSRKGKRKRKEEEEAGCVSWSCSSCTYSNSDLLPYCEVCENPRSTGTEGQSEGVASSSSSNHGLKNDDGSDEQFNEKQVVSDDIISDDIIDEDIPHPSDHTSTVVMSSSDDDDEGGDTSPTPTMTPPVHSNLQFCASRYTDRVYLYSKDGSPLNISFFPLDIKVNNWEELPEEFNQQKENQIQIVRFVQLWSTLSSMKQNVLRRSGMVFTTPSMALQHLSSTQRPPSSTSRFLSRVQVCEASLSRAHHGGGSVRLVTKTPSQRRKEEGGYLQAVDAHGLPLCLNCQQPCTTGGGAKDTCTTGGGAKDTCTTGGGAKYTCTTGGGAKDTCTIGGGAKNICTTGGGAKDTCITGGGASDTCTTGGGATDTCTTGSGAKDTCTTGGGASDTCTTGGGAKDTCTTGSGAKDTCITGGGAKDTCTTGGGASGTCTTGGGAKDTCITGGGAKDTCTTGGGASDTCTTGGGTWDAAFCSHKCQEEFQVRSSHSYMRSRVLEAENGVCQQCGLNAHQLFLRVRDAPPTHRKQLLENSWLSQLSIKQLNEMIRSPVEGNFWQVDHMVPVYGGGGQCSVDNLQTLCSVCHRARTSEQASERSLNRKKMKMTSSSSSDISRFFIKKS